MTTFHKVILIYYIVINIILLLTMGIDKYRAKKDGWRIPEANLFVLSLLGGSIGGFIGMFLFRHKKNKPSFYIIYGLSALFHILLMYFILFKK